MINVDNNKYAAFEADKTGLVAKDGEVFSVDGLMTEEGKDTKFEFKFSDNKDFKKNYCGIGENYEVVACVLPETPEQLGYFSHELAHAVSVRDMRDIPNQLDTYNQGHEKFEKLELGEAFVANNEDELNSQQVREIKVKEERGAWATGISLLREVGKTIPLENSATQNVGLMIKESERALRTYDYMPYNLLQQKDEDKIPAFSKEVREKSRELHKVMKEKGISYKDLPNFDDNTGQSIGNDPERLIEEVNKLDKLSKELESMKRQ
jgi:hypothetical protein